MARTQAADFGQRREFIIERAAQLYAERGYHGASMADVARACGMSKSLLYHYFPAKEDVLFEAMESHVKTLLDTATRISEMKAKPLDKFKELTHAFMHLYVGAEARHKVLLNELHRLPPERSKIIVARQRRLIALVANMLAEIQPRLARSDLKPAVAMLFFGMINWTHTWFDPTGPASTDTVAELIIGVMINGIK